MENINIYKYVSFVPIHIMIYHVCICLGLGKAIATNTWCLRKDGARKITKPKGLIQHELAERTTFVTFSKLSTHYPANQ